MKLSLFIAIILFTEGIGLVKAALGPWIYEEGNRTAWKKACTYPERIAGVETSTGVTKTNSLTSCSSLCWSNPVCSHFVFVNNATCFTKWKPESSWQPMYITNPKLANLYSCGYVPSRVFTSAIRTQKCNITSDPNKVSLLMGSANLPQKWISMLNNLVNMTLSLRVFGIPRIQILRQEQSLLYQSMQCLIGQDNVTAAIVNNLRICINSRFNKECNQIAPFNQSYMLDLCMSRQIITVNNRGAIDVRSAKKNWISTTALSSFHKANANKYFQTCLRRKMSASPVLVEMIIRDPLLNRAIVKTFISKAMKSSNLYYYGQSTNVDNYFTALKRMLCLVQSLLKNGCATESYKQISKRKNRVDINTKID